MKLIYIIIRTIIMSFSYEELKPGEAVLDWPTRKKVALGAARGLEYLHEQCNPKIIHRDVKAANDCIARTNRNWKECQPHLFLQFQSLLDYLILFHE
ncbi:hypothetical protein HN51_069821, partial [Arachis hypogaea]